jgi:hypothetical protein
MSDAVRKEAKRDVGDAVLQFAGAMQQGDLSIDDLRQVLCDAIEEGLPMLQILVSMLSVAIDLEIERSKQHAEMPA